MTEYARNQGLDKFYTNSNIVELCLSHLSIFHDWNSWDMVIEPSAGNGSFLYKIPSNKKIGIDILPEGDGIIRQDFLTFAPDKTYNNILVLGNPPFGKNSSIAVKFFNHSAQWASVIAFIIPKTFRRISIQNKLNLNFCLVSDIDIPMKPCSFSPPMSAKCCFQIWTRTDNVRKIQKLPTKHKDWDFLALGKKDEFGQPTPPVGADFAVRAYGGKCGEIRITKLDKLRPKSWHWIKSNIDPQILIERIKKLDYSSSKNTARQNSIGMADLICLYDMFINGVIPNIE